MELVRCGSFFHSLLEIITFYTQHILKFLEFSDRVKSQLGYVVIRSNG